MACSDGQSRQVTELCSTVSEITQSEQDGCYFNTNMSQSWKFKTDTWEKLLEFKPLQYITLARSVFAAPCLRVDSCSLTVWTNLLQMAFLSPLGKKTKPIKIYFHASTYIIKTRLIWKIRTLPILSNSVDIDDVVWLADCNFGGVRRERHVIHDVALFSILSKDWIILLYIHTIH